MQMEDRVAIDAIYSNNVYIGVSDRGRPPLSLRVYCGAATLRRSCFGQKHVRRWAMLDDSILIQTLAVLRSVRMFDSTRS